MASTTLQFLSSPSPSHHLTHFNPSKASLFLIQIQPRKQLLIKCSASDFPTPDGSSNTLNDPETFPIEKRRRSEILRDRRKQSSEMSKAEPPNFEIGWKRTKEIKVEEPIWYVIADFLEKLEGLMGKEFGSTELLAKAGEIVAERAREEVEVLRDEGKVEERMVIELFRTEGLEMKMELNSILDDCLV